MTSNQRSGVVTHRSTHSVDETVRRLEEALKAKRIQLFATVDHSGEAAREGLCMPNTKLLILSNAQAGTPIMLASPSAAIDLPLKILVSEDAEGSVWLSYNSVSYLQNRHGFSDKLAENISGLATVIDLISE